jgi:hypothetical protein
MEGELKNYTHIALIDTGVEGMAPMCKRAKENAIVCFRGFLAIDSRTEVRYSENIARLSEPCLNNTGLFDKKGAHSQKG